MSQTQDEPKKKEKKKPPVKPEQLRREAQRLGVRALEALASIMSGEGQDSARLAAAREVLDRAYGRPKPALTEADAEPLTVVLKQFSPPPEAEDEA